MDERNPYAPSRASLDSVDGRSTGIPSGVTVWRNQKVLVMLPGAQLPPRCVKCNGPAEEPTKVRKVYWHHPWVYFLILLNIIIYAIVATIVRKRALVAPGLCADHKRNRKIALLLAWGGMVVGVGLMMWGVGNQFAYFGLGMLLLLVAALLAIIRGRVLVARKIDKDYVWLRGCGSDFLDSLPPLP